jgi:hypothetical protein
MKDPDAAAQARHRKYYEGLEQLKSDHQLSAHGANDVLYLRTQPTHTPEKEQQLIAAHQSGAKPNVLDYT